MASPLASVIAMVVGAAFFVAGFLLLPTSVGTALLLFGGGMFLVGVGAALLGGLLILIPATVFAIVLVIAGLLIGRG